MHRAAVTVGTGGQATVDLPEHWSRIARDADAWAIPRSGEGTQKKDGRAWPRADVDLDAPSVTARARSSP